MRPKDTQSTLTLIYIFIMTFQLAAALLDRASNGNELLDILDGIVADDAADTVTEGEDTVAV